MKAHTPEQVALGFQTRYRTKTIYNDALLKVYEADFYYVYGGFSQIEGMLSLIKEFLAVEGVDLDTVNCSIDGDTSDGDPVGFLSVYAERPATEQEVAEHETLIKVNKLARLKAKEDELMLLKLELGIK